MHHAILFLRHRSNLIKEGVAWISAILIGIAASTIPFVVNASFFFNDDEQNQFYPYFIDIGQHLHSRQWPGVTLSTFYGGNVIDDWQYALYNPFSLLTYWIVASVGNLLLTGLFLAAIYFILIALGGYCLGSVFKVGRVYSLVIAAVLSMSNFIHFVHAYSWFPGLVSFAWFIWAWVFIEYYRQTGHAFSLIGLIISVYLVTTSGYPHTIIMLGGLIFGYAVDYLIVFHLWKKCAIFLMASLAAFMVALPFLLPAILSFEWMQRPSGIINNGLFTPDLGQVLNLSSIFFFPRIHLFQHDYPSYPMMYLAWFIVPLLPIIKWKEASRVMQDRPGLIVFTSIALFMLLGPQVLGPLQFPFRFLPYFHIAMLINFILLISSPGIFVINKQRLAFVILIIFIQFTSSVWAFPLTFFVQVSSAFLSCFFVYSAIRFVHCGKMERFRFLLLTSTLIIFALTLLLINKNTDLPHDTSPIRNNVKHPSVSYPFDGYTLYIGCNDNSENKDKNGWMAAEAIFNGSYVINGYSALKHSGLNPRIYADDQFRMLNEKAVDYLLSIDSATTRSVVSLMRVNRLVIWNDYLHRAIPLLPDNWIQTGNDGYATTFENTKPDRNRTTLAYASPGIGVTPGDLVTGEKEKLRVTVNEKGGQLIFARLWWPGYEARLDGKALTVGPLNKVFVRVDLPAGAQGNLTLIFVPPGFQLGLAFALLGILLCGCLVFYNYRYNQTYTSLTVFD